MTYEDDVDKDPSRPKAADWSAYAVDVRQEWSELLDRSEKESELQEFLEQNPSMLPGADGNVAIGGNHGTVSYDAAISQPRFIGLKTRVPDFMWVTKSSVTLEPVCIEIERANKFWFNPDGQQTAQLTEAHGQLGQWSAWFAVPENQLLFRRTFADNFPDHKLLPAYVLGYGRRSEFTEAGGRHADPGYMRMKRAEIAKVRETLMSLDSFEPNWKVRHAATLKMRDSGLELWALPRTFTTGPHMRGLAAKFTDPAEALARSQGWTDERREYVAKRWAFWRDVPSPSDGMTDMNVFSTYDE
ncbi:DUF4263 domain-containing protein [Aeromicrobium fastidiosum]|uniref:Shedu anti-phage system protein SduA domain-containing protein n=1 Tax=Aeromicrobium fastidiosum TaxID=52699 RepID=UPI0020232079|nr:Shedu anti-phage system protein SduA domain-containing protein [Aeromicrobium fastidiosum]MCL8251349.1 DUF4263 domain-containing protein [Aeromicrobium fastidiosum]